MVVSNKSKIKRTDNVLFKTLNFLFFIFILFYSSSFRSNEDLALLRVTFYEITKDTANGEKQNNFIIMTLR